MSSNPSLKSFTNRTVVVSGGGGRLGRVICLALAQEGANVVVNDVKAEPVEELIKSLSEKGYSAFAIVTSATEGEAIITQTIQKFGHFRAAFEANTYGPLAVTKAAWPRFKAQKYGRVVNFTSDSVLEFPTASQYTMTKGSLFGVNKTLAQEGAPHRIKNFSADVRYAFKNMFPPEANVPMILALASEGCTANGEVFNTVGWASGKSVWGVQRGLNGLRTVQDCLDHMNEITTKGDVFVPKSMVDYSEFFTAYALGKEYKP